MNQKTYSPTVFVEIIAKQKGCMLCDLAIAILEETAPEFEEGALKWEVVDVGSREGIIRHEALADICKLKPAVPSIVINDRIAFNHIPDMEELTAEIRNIMSAKK